MARPIEGAVGQSRISHEGVATRDWRKLMSDNVASALIVYTGLQIFVTVQELKDGLPDILPYLALVVLVAGIIPACRRFERRWTVLPDEKAHDPDLRGAFWNDALMLWGLALGLPLILTLVFRAAFG